MQLKYESFKFTPVLGWSTSRYEIFDKCKRQYFYNYYSKYVKDIPTYKMQMLRDLTSIPLEIGNVIHDIIETFLRRLQVSDSDINELKFYEYAKHKVIQYFSQKTFIEKYYNQIETIDMDYVQQRTYTCLSNFMGSNVYSWIIMKAITNRNDWMIEPDKYGETRLNGLKAYCKMDFLFPVDGLVYILDWKTGKSDPYKHNNQLIGYSAAASSNFGIKWNTIFPRIIYLYPEFSELEIELKEDDLHKFLEKVKEETEQMYNYCSNIDNNIPLPIEKFPETPSTTICKYCNYQELCFDKLKKEMPDI